LEPGTAPDRLFPEGATWYEDLRALPVDASSDVVIGGLQDHGWGLGRMQIDFEIDVLQADASTPRVPFTPTADFYSPDCDQVDLPLPEDGHVEGETDYRCRGGGDCHLLVLETDEQRLYEMWRGDQRGSTLHGGCLAVWDLQRAYPPEGRGEQCTSADAAGYPITQLLFTADEVAAGEITHAIRLVLPNTIIRDGEYFHPATHAVNVDGGGAEAVPYGARLRLRPDFDLEQIASPSARVIAVAMQTYGLYLADGGNVALTARADHGTEHTWDELGVDSHALDVLQPADFELVELGARQDLTFDCVRAEGI
jgi:serine/threonine-protein kinase